VRKTDRLLVDVQMAHVGQVAAKGKMRPIGLLVLVACSSTGAQRKATAPQPTEPAKSGNVSLPSQTPDGILKESDAGANVHDPELGLKIHFPIGPVKVRTSPDGNRVLLAGRGETGFVMLALLKNLGTWA